jgi:trimethylamine--corrinoid protein Co-methyltransferase
MTNSDEARIRPIRPATRLRFLSDAQLELFQGATLKVLAETGIHCPSERALGIYAQSGADVDFEAKIVRMSPEVVLECMSRAPRFYTMGAQDPKCDLVLDGTATYIATDGCGVECVDDHTRERRASLKIDVARSARVADYLDAVAFYWPMVSASDHPAAAPLHELHAAFANTVKHIQTETVMDESMARSAVEMATVIAGDEESMRRRPPLSSLICTIAPLAQDEGGMEAALVFAEAGLPVGFMSMANTGSTAPATIEGTIVVCDVEIVAAMVLIQMAYPGAPTYHSLMPGMMHPRTGDYRAAARAAGAMFPAGTELAHKWGVPTLAGVFGPDAKEPGWESGMRSALTLTLHALCGAETGSGMGLLGGSTVLYPEALVLDSEIYHHVRSDLEAVDPNPISQALGVIQDVGPRGHFLGERHTRAQLRRLEHSQVLDQPAKSGGYRDAVMVAQERTRWIMENHRPKPLPDEVSRELQKILRAAEGELRAGARTDASSP